ncbi:hypothetical protein BJF86_03100 [Serinicoccus sp. CNJ-927]|uniref:hypothetical protein n=1 Tax=Serinicoccus sp. CNJ-927 TaxID=1904970 RepID=UPI00095CAC15|nr:hypothetical protein [Serinicoccus sp. CNJ-927]OLT41991.1 hypothetical protein BJF86_03100 [Serinicoccus sp. CNJ-927]
MEPLTTVIVAVLSSGALSALITVALNERAERRKVRRERYVQVVSTLVAKAEMPYRVRRRVDDRPGTLQNLAGQIHDLQEQLVVDETWVAADSAEVLEGLRSVRKILDPWFTEQCQAAWRASLIVDGPSMNLDPPLPPAPIRGELVKLQESIAKRTSVWVA